MRGNKLVLLILLFVLALFSTSRLIYLALYGLAGLYFLLVREARRVFASLTVTRTLSVAKAFAGQETLVSLEVRNPSRLPLGWLCVSPVRQANLMPIGAGARAELMPGRGRLIFDYRVIGARRGYYPLGPLRLTGGDPLGWFAAERLAPDPGGVLVVYPRVSSLGQLDLPMMRPFGKTRDKSRAHEDPSRLSGIRDYQPGDSLRRIHWKATAASGRLQVKEMMPTVMGETILLLNLNETDYPRGTWWSLGEAAIETAASLVTHLAAGGAALSLVSNGRDPMGHGGEELAVPAATGPEQAEIILTVLARVEMAPGRRLADLAARYGNAASWGTRLFLLTPLWSTELDNLSSTLRRHGKMPIPVLIGAYRQAKEAARAGLPCLLARPDQERGGVKITLAE